MLGKTTGAIVVQGPDGSYYNAGVMLPVVTATYTKLGRATHCYFSRCLMI